MKEFFRVAAASLALCSVYAESASAQETDSLKFYRLSEIVISSGEDRPETGTAVREIPLADMARADAASVAGFIRLIPSAHLQTNSRGEALVYIRNSGERQTAVFLDGALLNIPWDNRVDLSMLPATALGRISVVQGGSSVAYGSNTLGGVVNLQTRDLDAPSSITEAGLGLGMQGRLRFQGLHMRRTDAWSFLAAAGSSETDGAALPENAELPYGQDGTDVRTNTDRRTSHFLARAERRAGRASVGLTVFHADSRKGVAPEGHLDPSLETVRYWRYPEWRTTMAIASFALSSGSSEISGTAWGSLFNQKIDDFASVAYDRLEQQQKDRDETVGMRLVALRRFDAARVRVSMNLLGSRHEQRDGAVDVTGDVVFPPADLYSQRLGSVGLEYELVPTRSTRLEAGLALDTQVTPQTGDKSARDRVIAWSGTVGGVKEVADGWNWRVNLGRKIRFPTMRELFGTALNRFLVNDSLRPESAILFETGLRFASPELSGEMAIFGNRTADTIDQTNVVVNDTRLRQRINLSGSSVFGAELLARAKPSDRIEVEGHATLMRSRVRGETDRNRLTEKPSALVSTTVSLSASWGGTLSLDATYTGGAQGLDPENRLVSLGSVLQMGGRLGWRHYVPSARLFMELFARVDNLTDQALYPQLGLPAEGRTIRGGLNVSF